MSFSQVDFGSFATILREVAAMTQLRAGGVFYDLGSGTGKAVYVVRDVVEVLAVCVCGFAQLVLQLKQRHKCFLRFLCVFL